MNTPRLRMIAGPNGSGKSSLFYYLRDALSVPVGRWLNPDELERRIRQAGRMTFDSPATLNAIVSVPAVLFERVSASRSDPAPASFTFVTVKTVINTRDSSGSTGLVADRERALGR